jgi:aryl-alcohol dehydrogenase-like predicted oxidoreductase
MITASMCSMTLPARMLDARPHTVNAMAPRSPLPARAGDRGPRRIGIGLAALGRPGYLNLGHGADLGADRSVEALRARSFEVLDVAYASGVRYLDAARSYGRGEEFLGAWLRDRDPHDVVVGSKWGYVYTADWEVAADPPEVKHHDVETFRRQLEETRANLGDRLALYQIHSATPDSGVLENHAVLDALADLRSEGVAIGLSTSGTSQAQTLDRALALDLFDTAQVTWNLHERAAGTALKRVHAAGMGVIVKEALANGRLATRGEVPALDRVADRLGAGPDAVALAAVLAQPFVDVVLSGVATVGTLQSNLVAAGLELDDAALFELDGLEEDSAAYWAQRGELPWN